MIEMCQQLALDMQTTTLASERLDLHMDPVFVVALFVRRYFFDSRWLLLDPVMTLWSYFQFEIHKPLTSNSRYNVNPVLVKLGFLPIRFCLTKRLSTVPFELFEEASPTLTADYLTLLSGNLVRVPLPTSQHQLVRVCSASLPFIPYVTANLRTPTKVEQAVFAQSTVHYDGTYTVPSTIDIDGMSLTPSTVGLAMRLHVITRLRVTVFWLRGSMGIFSRRCDFSTDFSPRGLVVCQGSSSSPPLLLLPIVDLSGC
jgi:hypothetical protein